jgi:type I restriction enzyme S subunit
MANERCCIGRGVAALRHKSGSASYTYAVGRSLSRRFEVFNSEGTVFGSINKADFGKLQVLVPPPSNVAEFTASVTPIDDRMHLNESQSRTLAELRDTLLPKLISGELRVPDAEALVEAAL